jgi:Kef-type K+ transport system membrane component KefB
VVGEIAAGLLLGPSFFGRFFPELSANIFDPAVGPIFAVLSQLGLIFLMFLIGIHFDFSHISSNRKVTSAVAVVGIALPFALGLLVALPLLEATAPGSHRLAFALFLATAFSITAIPILGRILMEFNLTHTRIGAITITAAAFNDAAGWILLAFVAALAKSQAAWSRAVVMLIATAAFTLFVMSAGRWLLLKWLSRLKPGQNGISQGQLAVLLLAILVCASITNLIGIFAIFGAFVLGAALHDQHAFKESVLEKLQDFVTVFFLPIFFTYTGLRTDVGTMDSPQMWLWCGVVVLLAMIGKFCGCTLAAKAGGFPWRESASIGILMNTRALMELIVINVGYELGVIPRSVFFMLVMMALVTTFMASPILRWLIPGSELEEPFSQSDLAKRGWLGIR